eukprot:8441939-Prorocentrum_lima.AAC.1
MKIGKAPGTDKITAHMLKAMNPISTASMKEITDKVLTQQTIPEQWKKDYIIAKEKKKRHQRTNTT